MLNLLRKYRPLKSLKIMKHFEENAILGPINISLHKPSRDFSPTGAHWMDECALHAKAKTMHAALLLPLHKHT